MTLQLDPPAPPRRSASTSCDLHPGETFTGFCAACLRERLAGLEASAAAASAPGRKSTSAIRSLFARPFAAAASSSAAAEPPDLRRCKSFSCGRGGDVLATAAAAAAAAARADEPQRRSCDVRGRSTLWALFHQDDRDRVRDGTAFGAFPASSSAAAAALAADVVMPQPPPPCVIPDDFMEEEEEEDIPVVMESDEIIPVVEESFVAMDISGEMEEDKANAEGNKAIKDHIDAEQASKKASPKDLKEIAGSFWVAASVFSKKWQKWRRKQKLKKEEAAAATVSKAAAAAMPAPSKPPKPSFLRRRRGDSELFAGGGGARRSCDTDPRFSLDAARMSVDDAGFSWDEPRASWDGYLFGGGAGVGVGRAPPPLSRLPPILSVMEDTPVDIVERSDGQIPVEDDEFEPPGGSLQTRDYYLDSSSRRRRSLERTSSVRRPSFEVGTLERTSSVRRPSFEVTDVPMSMPMAATNGRVESPIGGSEFYHFHHAEDLLDRGFSSNSLIEDISASLEAALSGPAKKKPRRWSKAWSLWGLINRRDGAGRRSGGGGGGPSDIAGRSFSEPWPDLRVRGANPKMQRCGSNLSARSSFSSNSGGLGSSRRSHSYVVDGGNVRRRDQEQQQLERNRGSAAAAADSNGMLRFYLTPMRSGSVTRRGGGGVPSSKAGPGRPLTSQSFARSVLRMY